MTARRGLARRPSRFDHDGVTSSVVTTIEGALVFAGIPLAVVGVVFGAIFSTTPKPPFDEAKKNKKKS